MAYGDEELAKQAQTPGYAEALQPARETLIGRIRNQVSRCSREARKAKQYKELQYLLDKNPEVARILELLDVVQA